MTSPEHILDQARNISGHETLCRQCKNTFQPEHPVKIDDFITLHVPFHSRPWQLIREKDSSNTCPFCLFFVAFASHAWTGHQHIERLAEIQEGKLKSPVFLVQSTTSSKQHEISIEIQNRHLFPHYEHKFALVFVNDPRIELASPISPLSCSTASESSFEKIVSWVNVCSTTHLSCRQQSQRNAGDTAWSPTRLLQVHPGHQRSPSVLRLVNSQEGSIQKSYQYATLSYCWGTEPFIKLQKSNLSEFKKGIDLSLLPKTFKDAIVAAERLGIQYLWIDALCIIQDSPEDWDREAVMMSKVYSYSTLTLAAAASRNSNGGLFYERDPLLCNGIKLSVSWDNDSIAAWDGSTQDFYCIRIDPWITSVRESPLLKRAWVFQESLLSPRTVYFASDQLYWECGELCASEVYPTGGPWDLEFRERTFDTAKRVHEELQPGNDGRFKHSCFAALAEGVDSADMTITERLPYLWANIVSRYSSGELTFEKDKLVAISGVAKILSKLLKDDKYIAGLWKSSLASSLLWSHNDDGRTKEYQAPSWSWASVSGGVGMDLVFRSLEVPKIKFEILDVQVIPANTGDITGSINGGVLRVKGALCKVYHSVELEKDLRGPFSWTFYNRRIIGKSAGYTWLPYRTEQYLIFKKTGFATTSYPSKFLFDQRPKKKQAIYLLEMATGRVKYPWRVLDYIAGLMLEPTGAKGQFSRIGYFELIPETMRRSWRASRGVSWRALAGDRKVLENELFKSAEIDSRCYESRDDDQYTISII